MSRARKRAVEVEFYRTTALNSQVDHPSITQDSWTGLIVFSNYLVRVAGPEGDSNWKSYYVFDRLHDTWVQFEAGDIILKGVQGEFYPIKPDIFEETYEVIDENTSTR